LRAKRVDVNQKEIVAALRQLGFSVTDLSAVGKGCPDLLAGKHGITYLFEIKRDNKAKFTEHQIQWQKEWKGGIFARIEAIDDVIKLATAVQS
jgi:Holliday junction resolvase